MLGTRTLNKQRLCWLFTKLVMFVSCFFQRQWVACSCQEVIAVFFGASYPLPPDWLLLRHYNTRVYVRFRHNGCFRHMDCLHCRECGFPIAPLELWTWANRLFIRLTLFCLFTTTGCFCEPEDRCYASFLEPISSKVRGHRYISAAVRTTPIRISATSSSEHLEVLTPEQLWRLFLGFKSSPAIMAPILLNCMGSEHNEYIKWVSERLC